MKGVLYISFLVCILLGCSDSDGLPDGEKDKTARTEPVSYTHLTLPTNSRV